MTHVRPSVKALIYMQLVFIAIFGLVSGVCITSTLRHRVEEAEHGATMVHLMSHSLKELGEIRVKEI